MFVFNKPVLALAYRSVTQYVLIRTVEGRPLPKNRIDILLQNLGIKYNPRLCGTSLINAILMRSNFSKH